jgi:hypothetical protein
VRPCLDRLKIFSDKTAVIPFEITYPNDPHEASRYLTSTFPFVNQTNLTSVSTIVLSLTARVSWRTTTLRNGYSQNSARSSTQVEIA